MSDLHRQLIEDRALRDAALALVKADLALVRADLEERGIGSRIGHRLSDSTMDMIDDAVDFAEENKGTVAAGLAAIILWFAREPILDGLASLLGLDEDEEEPGERPSRFSRD